jgi:hypothetical protein
LWRGESAAADDNFLCGASVECLGSSFIGRLEDDPNRDIPIKVDASCNGIDANLKPFTAVLGYLSR